MVSVCSSCNMHGFLSLLIGAIYSQDGKGSSEELSSGLTFEAAELVVRTGIFILSPSICYNPTLCGRQAVICSRERT